MESKHLNYSIQLKLPAEEIRVIDKIGDAVKLTTEQAINIIVRMAAADCSGSVAQIKDFLKSNSAPVTDMLGFVEDGKVKQAVVSRETLKTDEFYSIERTPPTMRRFLEQYIELAQKYKKLMSLEHISADGFVSGYAIARLMKVVRRKNWDADMIIEAISRMPWYNGTDAETTWSGATLKWLTQKTKGEDMYGYERLIVNFKRAKEEMKTDHGTSGDKLSGEDKAKLRDVLKKIARDGGITPNMDLYKPTALKLLRVAEVKGAQYCVASIGREGANSFDCLEKAYNELVKSGKISIS